MKGKQGDAFRLLFKILIGWGLLGLVCINVLMVMEMIGLAKGLDWRDELFDRGWMPLFIIFMPIELGLLVTLVFVPKPLTQDTLVCSTCGYDLRATSGGGRRRRQMSRMRHLDPAESCYNVTIAEESAMTTATKMTAQQFLMMGEDPPGLRLELVNGEIVVSPSPSYEHSFTEKMLSHLLMSHILEHDLGSLVGDVDTIFNDLNVRRPDIIYIAKSRLRLLKGHGIPIAPDLCVEIISPASATLDQTEKFSLYEASGVAHYWIVDPKGHTFDAYKLTGKKYVRKASGRDRDILKAPPFPTLKIPLAQLWSPLD